MESTKSKTQLVGAQIPDRLFQLINLYCITEDSSKSQVIRDSLLLWVEQNEVQLEDLIEDLRLELKARWLRYKNNDDEYKADFITWINSQRESLNNQKVSEKITDEIFKDF